MFYSIVGVVSIFNIHFSNAINFILQRDLEQERSMLIRNQVQRLNLSASSSGVNMFTNFQIFEVFFC